MTKRAPKVATEPKPLADEDATLDHTPDRSTKAWHYKQYAAAFAEGMMRAIGTTFAEPSIKGPTDAMIRLCRAHAEGRRGGELHQWIEDITYEFRQNANERDVTYNGGWSPRGLLWWLNMGKPGKVAARQAGAASITVRKV